MLRPPPLQSLPGLLFGGGPGDLDEWHGRPASPRRTGSLARCRRRDDTLPVRHAPGPSSLRGLDPRWLTGLLREVRRPGRVAEPGRLVLGRELENGFE